MGDRFKHPHSRPKFSDGIRHDGKKQQSYHYTVLITGFPRNETLVRGVGENFLTLSHARNAHAARIGHPVHEEESSLPEILYQSSWFCSTTKYWSMTDLYIPRNHKPPLPSHMRRHILHHVVTLTIFISCRGGLNRSSFLSRLKLVQLVIRHGSHAMGTRMYAHTTVGDEEKTTPGGYISQPQPFNTKQGLQYDNISFDEPFGQHLLQFPEIKLLAAWRDAAI